MAAVEITRILIKKLRKNATRKTMKIIKIDNQKFAAFGDVRLPLREFLVNTIDDVESLNRDQWAGIIRDGGVEVPEGMEDQDLLHLAMSFAQNAWYHGTQGRISNNIHDKHAKRLERFKGLAAAVKARTPQVATPRVSKKESAQRKLFELNQEEV